MFSVVIPVYNHEHFLREAVDSALNSDLVKEVLLCDDGSIDGSAALCAKLSNEYPERVLDLSDFPSINRGAHIRLNQLCSSAKQPWLRVLNSDDFFLPTSFEALQVISITHKANFISGSMLICNSRGEILGTKKGVFDPEYPLPHTIDYKSFYKNNEVRKQLLNQNFIATTSNMAFSKELFEKTGGFQDFRYAHDLDFALRATMLGKAVWTAAFLATYRIHGSNTISEVSPHMDGEMTRLYVNFLDDYPEIERDPSALEFLQGNRHIAPFPASPKIKSSPASRGMESGLAISPGLPDGCLPNVLLSLGAMDYDFVVVSRSLADPPSAVIPSLQDSVATVGRAATLTNKGAPPPGSYKGRLLRFPPREKAGNVSALIHTLGSMAVVEGPDIYFGGKIKVNLQLRPSILDELKQKLVVNQFNDRPVVFVLPIFLAVVCVERNTIEVIRNLKDYYRFIVITTEYLSERQGSLHWQLEALSVPVFDLAEIAGQEHHMELLSVLAHLLPPDLVWICNGSPWLVQNSVNLRRLFANVPIIDQEVYDTNEGWIAYYDNRGIQSFDRFVAINSKIRAKFTGQFRIPPHRVSLVYHAMSVDAVRESKTECTNLPNLHEEFLIPNTYDKIFVFVGRLTDQKKPHSFLELVRSAQSTHPRAYFIMIGDGELACDCDEFIIANRLLNIHRIPYHPCPPKVMARADGMIITSIYEGLPIAMLEALAVGIPVLSTDVGDIRLILEEYGSGLVSDFFDDQGKPALPVNLWGDFMNKLEEFSAAASLNAKRIIMRFGAEKISDEYNFLFKNSLLEFKINSSKLELP